MFQNGTSSTGVPNDTLSLMMYGQAQDHSVHESRSNDQDHSLISDLANIASELAIGLIASGQEKKSEEQDLAPNKKRGPRL